MDESNVGAAFWWLGSLLAAIGAYGLWGPYATILAIGVALVAFVVQKTH